MRNFDAYLFASLTSAAFLLTACTRGPDLPHTVGQSSANALPPRDPDAGPATTTPKAKSPGGEVDLYLTGQSAGPCEMDSLPVITFDFGSSDPGESQSVELQRVARCLTVSPYETTSIVVVGYTDVIGTAPANLTLGLDRAQAVMRRLIDAGVPAGRFVIASGGELQRPRARLGLRADRVEILIARGDGSTRPNEAPITRGIDAEGLMPRTPRPADKPASPSPTPTPQPARPRPPQPVTPPPRSR